MNTEEVAEAAKQLGMEEGKKGGTIAFFEIKNLLKWRDILLEFCLA